MDAGTKLILIFILPMIMMVTWLWACEREEPPAIKSEWHLEGTVGGRHAMRLTLRREGAALSGEAINTRGEARSIDGRLEADQTFLFHERNGGEITGDFEGRVLANGDLRGIWSQPQGDRWFPFYLRAVPPEALPRPAAPVSQMAAHRQTAPATP